MKLMLDFGTAKVWETNFLPSLSLFVTAAKENEYTRSNQNESWCGRCVGGQGRLPPFLPSGVQSSGIQQQMNETDQD